jgi:hypothetical protein
MGDVSRQDVLNRMLRIPAALGVIAGGFLYFVTSQDQKILDRVRPAAAAVSLAQLIQNGPGSNHHVRVSGFRFSPTYAVRTKMQLMWTGVAMELIPEGSTGAGPVQAVAFFGQMGGESAVAKLMRTQELTGLVLNGLPDKPSYNDSLLEKLATNRPGTRPNQVLRIDGTPDLPDPDGINMRWKAAYVLLGIGVLSVLLIVLGGPDSPTESD